MISWDEDDDFEFEFMIRRMSIHMKQTEAKFSLLGTLATSYVVPWSYVNVLSDKVVIFQFIQMNFPGKYSP